MNKYVQYSILFLISLGLIFSFISGLILSVKALNLIGVLDVDDFSIAIRSTYVTLGALVLTWLLSKSHLNTKLFERSNGTELKYASEGSVNASEQQIEQEIQDKGLNAPRLTPEHIDNVIAGETYTNLPDGRTVICQLTLKNGYTIDGKSACVSKENFNQEIGNKIARQNAREKIWELEGYLLKEKLHLAELDKQF